ncbi:MAG: polysulfide reductase NrfD [Armatimonadetes bacterium]|nr:polysulfide reductase NrfD [Armatimonadota bacterium]
MNATTTLGPRAPRLPGWAWAIWLALFALGSIGMFQRFAFGHRLAGYGSYVPWGLWVSAYIWLVGISAGAFLVCSFGIAFRVEPIKRIARIGLVTALIALVCGLFAIGLDLGHLFRAYAVFTRPNFGSMMTWMIWLYAAYAILIVVQLYLMTFRSNSDHAVRKLAIVGIPLAIAFSGGVGALFGTVSARPLWHSGLFPILFLTGALVSGTALLLAITALLKPLPARALEETAGFLVRLLIGLLLLDVVLEWAEFSIPLWYGIGHDVGTLKLILFGPFWWVFWIVHLALGTLVPLWALARSKSMALHGLAGLLVAVMFMAVRLNIVIPALVTPEIEGLQNSFRDHRLTFTYIPTLHEWLVLLFIVCLGLGLFAAAYKFLAGATGKAGSPSHKEM